MSLIRRIFGRPQYDRRVAADKEFREAVEKAKTAAKPTKRALQTASLVLSLALIGACASTLDASAAAQNLANVQTLGAENLELHGKAGSDAATVATAKAFNESAVRLAEAMLEGARR